MWHHNRLKQLKPLSYEECLQNWGNANFLLNEEITAINIGFALCVLAVVVLGKKTKAK
jgi:hypothetical protein